jgi:glutamate-1-semialdehyde 2,1-aminomutase
VRQGSLFWLSLQEGEPPRSAEAIDPAAAGRYRPVFHALLDDGIALAPSAFEAGFLSLAHTPRHLMALRDALASAFAGAPRRAFATAGAQA